uniref:Uncharacterized protein MANES_09G018800 n=1 Tax=Rhizophora mucronata TaxID=61149 RepID=A0A2P2P5L9_RHIMU
MLDSAHLSFEADGEYDYDDLDQVANEDDEDLIGITSDVEVDVSLDDVEGEDFGTIVNSDGEMPEDDDDDEAGVMEDKDGGDKRKRKGKSKSKKGASPFASIEDYEHLLREDSPTRKKSTRKKIPKSQKKRKLYSE